MSEPVSIDTLDMILNDMAEQDVTLRHDGEIILNGSLLRDYEDLQREKRELIGSVKDSMGGVDTSELDAKIEAVREQASQFVIRLHFKAVSNDEYLRVVARHPEAKNGWDPENAAPWAEFVTDLATICYTGCTVRGEDRTKEQAPLSKFTSHPAVGFGQLDPIFSDVLAMNKREPDRSFLSKR